MNSQSDQFFILLLLSMVTRIPPEKKKKKWFSSPGSLESWVCKCSIFAIIKISQSLMKMPSSFPLAKIIASLHESLGYPMIHRSSASQLYRSALNEYRKKNLWLFNQQSSASEHGCSLFLSITNIHGFLWNHLGILTVWKKIKAKQTKTHESYLVKNFWSHLVQWDLLLLRFKHQH